MKKVALVFLMLFFTGTNIYAQNQNQNAELIQEPNVDAIGAILIDYKTGRVLWEKNQHEPMAMASTTKIMTALFTLENGNMNDEVTVSGRAASAPEVKMFLKTGERIKLESLLYALMLQSSNDAAVAIAEHISGSVEEFCRQMTEKAKTLGALDTIFETPNGLDAGDHHSTAYDMAIITRAAISNPEFMRIINTPSVTVESDRKSYYISNRNRLLNEYSGANGVKTGFTGKAGHCFVGAAEREDMQLISVVLASGWGNKGKEQKWIDTKRLLNYGFAAFKYEEIVKKGDGAKEVFVDRSKTPSITLYFEDGLLMPLTEAEQKGLQIEIYAPDEIRAPVHEGDVLGEAKVLIAGKPTKEINLVAGSSAERHDLKTSLEKILDHWFEMGTNSNVETTLPEF